MSRPKTGPWTGPRFTVASSLSERSSGPSRYRTAAKKAMQLEGNPRCNCIEIFKAGKPFQAWVRNRSGDWNFCGRLFDGETR